METDGWTNAWNVVLPMTPRPSCTEHQRKIIFAQIKHFEHVMYHDNPDDLTRELLRDDLTSLREMNEDIHNHVEATRSQMERSLRYQFG